MRNTILEFSKIIVQIVFTCVVIAGSMAIAHSSDLIISGVIDGPLSGGLPKAVEFYAVNNIDDLSIYGFGSANNGDGSDGVEFTFPAVSASAGEFLIVASEMTGFSTFFGFPPDYTSGAANINGDDAIELFENGSVVDVFGDINVDGSGQPWEYSDGWAYRVDSTGPDGNTFMFFNWMLSGPNALDGATTNDTTAIPFPLGTYNREPVISACGDPATLIHEVQGNGLTSPMEGEIRTIEGIVVGDFQNNGMDDHGDLSGFFVQEEDSDADASAETSEGIYVFAPVSVDIEIGNKVRVIGTVQEDFDNTRLGNVTEIINCGPAELPSVTDVTLPVAIIDDFEPFEGMFVRFPQPLVISEFSSFDRFGEIVLAIPATGQTRPYQPTAVAAPGSAAAADLAALNPRSRITLDDGRTTQNPDPAIHPNGDIFDLTNRFRGGDIVQNATGILNFSFGLYRLQPTIGADYIPINPRAASPDDVGGSLKVAGFNVLNYFLTLDNNGSICGPLQNQSCRGADDINEFIRQRAKILSALAVINTEVFGLVELENTTGVEPLSDIVSGLNDMLGANSYDYINTGTIGDDAIKVGIIYKPATVTPAGSYAILDSTVDPRFNDDRNRPALAQTFMQNDNGEKFTVAVNHLKSKGSSCGAGDDDPQQGNCNLTRTLAAGALVDWLAADPTSSGDPDFIILGDLNAYDKEDPINAILAGADDVPGTADDYTDLIAANQGELAYSYVFDGQFGYLDYALSSASMTPQSTGVTEWHINADEPDILDYDTSFKKLSQQALYEPNAFRSSDHDPVIVGLNLQPVAESCPADDDGDKDVDGADLAAYIYESGGLGLDEFAANFGTENCLW
jgi:predicted extracellular nuclease